MNEKIKHTTEMSKELVHVQLENYTKLNNKAGVVLNMLAIFIPIYLFVIEHSNQAIKYWSICTVFLFVLGIISMLLVLNSSELHIGVNEDMYDEFINKENLDDILLIELGANITSIKANDDILKKQSFWYRNGIILVIVSVIVATILLTFSIFYAKESKDDKTMSEKDKSKNTKTAVIQPKVTIPTVSKSVLKTIHGSDTTGKDIPKKSK